MSKLQALAAFLGGASQGVGQGLMQREEQKRAEQERLDRKAQQDAERMFREAQQAMQERQFAETQTNNAAARSREQAQEEREAFAFGKGNAATRATQYTPTEALPDDVAADATKFGLRVDRGVNGLPAQTGLPGVGDVVTPSLIGGDGMGARRGFKTADEISKADTDKLIADLERTHGKDSPIIAALRVSGGKMGGVSADLVKTPAQLEAEREAELANEIKLVQARGAAAQPPADPLVSVVGPEGRPILVPRSQAAGMEPASTSRSTSGGDDATKTITLLEEASSVLKDLDPSKPGFNSAVGAGWQTLPFMDGPPSGSAGAGYKARLDRFKALNVLPRLSVMKGLGQMSNIEFDTVTKASTDLDPTLPETEFIRLYQTTVDAIDKAMRRAKGGTNVVTDPDGDGVPNAAPQGGRASGAGPAGAGVTRYERTPDGKVRVVAGGGGQ